MLLDPLVEGHTFGSLLAALHELSLRCLLTRGLAATLPVNFLLEPFWGGRGCVRVLFLVCVLSAGLVAPSAVLAAPTAEPAVPLPGHERRLQCPLKLLERTTRGIRTRLSVSLVSFFLSFFL